MALAFARATAACSLLGRALGAAAFAFAAAIFLAFFHAGFHVLLVLAAAGLAFFHFTFVLAAATSRVLGICGVRGGVMATGMAFLGVCAVMAAAFGLRGRG